MRTATTASINLATLVRDRGAELGLHRIGFVRPDLSEAAGRLNRWLAAGHHGEMAYMARRTEERSDPSRLFAGFASAIVVSEPYAQPGDVFAEMADPSRAYIAQYARGADYHERLKNRLEELMQTVAQAVPDVQYRVYVDTGPVLEKTLSAQAGIGWQGKHTNLVDPTGGNWLFLGIVLTNLELPQGALQEDRCGTCTDCITACPTDAFPAPYVLDARRCISYLTIENKGPIPRNMRPLIGNRVFGCDDCLAVCPWNRFAVAAKDSAYLAREMTALPALIDLMATSPQGFNRHFKHTPLHRTKRRGLLRNVAVALGNWGAPEAAPVLVNALEDEAPLIRGHAGWALGKIGGNAPALHAALENETDPWVREEFSTALLP